MKRIFAILLIIPVFLFSVPFALPVSASETNGQYFDVLDYVGVNGTTSFSSQISGLTEVVFDLSLLLGEFTAFGFDLTFVTDSNADILRSVSFGNSSSSLKGGYVKDGVYRYRGNFEGVSGSLFSLLFSSSYPISVNFISFNVYTVWDNYTPISGRITTIGESKEFTPGFTSTISSLADEFGNSVSITFENWRNYDYIEFGLAFYVNDIHSVFVGLQTNTGQPPQYSIPFTLTPFTASSDGLSLYAFTCRIDLTELNHVTAPDSYVVVNFSLSTVPDSYNTVTFYNANGIVFQGESDPSLKWYQIIFTNFSSFLSNIDNSISNFSDSVTSLFDNWFNSLFVKMEEYFGSDDSAKEEADQKLEDFDSSLQEFEDLNENFKIPDEEIDFTIQIPDLNIGFSLFLARLYALPFMQSYLIFGFSIGLIGFVIFGKR